MVDEAERGEVALWEGDTGVVRETGVALVVRRISFGGGGRVWVGGMGEGLRGGCRGSRFSFLSFRGGGNVWRWVWCL